MVTALRACQTRVVNTVEQALVCSAKGCREPAAWVLRWNNPKLHPPERRKTWLACNIHRTTLGDFLATRGFLREIEPSASRAMGVPHPPTLDE